MSERLGDGQPQYSREYKDIVEATKKVEKAVTIFDKRSTRLSIAMIILSACYLLILVLQIFKII